jgi:hypothetical protein
MVIKCDNDGCVTRNNYFPYVFFPKFYGGAHGFHASIMFMQALGRDLFHIWGNHSSFFILSLLSCSFFSVGEGGDGVLVLDIMP